MCFFSMTTRWHRLLKTTGLTKGCFMSFMPFPWLTRHIITNYTDRLSFAKTPWQQTPAISDRADRSVGCRRLHLGLCVVIHLWYAYMLKSSFDKYVFCKPQMGRIFWNSNCSASCILSLPPSLSHKIYNTKGIRGPIVTEYTNCTAKDVLARVLENLDVCLEV